MKNWCARCDDKWWLVTRDKWRWVTKSDYEWWLVTSDDQRRQVTTFDEYEKSRHVRRGRLMSDEELWRVTSDDMWQRVMCDEWRRVTKRDNKWRWVTDYKWYDDEWLDDKWRDVKIPRFRAYGEDPQFDPYPQKKFFFIIPLSIIFPMSPQWVSANHFYRFYIVKSKVLYSNNVLFITRSARKLCLFTFTVFNVESAKIICRSSVRAH